MAAHEEEHDKLPSAHEALSRAARLLRQAEDSVGMEASGRMVDIACGWMQYFETAVVIEVEMGDSDEED